MQQKPDLAWVYLDESGGLRADKPFVVGFWATRNPLRWLTFIRKYRELHNAWGELHFHAISRKPTDRRYLLARDILRAMQYAGNWYARFIYVAEDYLDQWRSAAANQVYTFIIKQLCTRFLPYVQAREARLVIDRKVLPACDVSIPYGLEAVVNSLSSSLGGPHFEVETADSATNDLLQVSDLMTAAMRQFFVPSGNQNKEELGSIVAGMRGGQKVRLWDWPSNWPTEKEGASN
jgi:hypothetical protein